MQYYVYRFSLLLMTWNVWKVTDLYKRL